MSLIGFMLILVLLGFMSLCASILIIFLDLIAAKPSQKIFFLKLSLVILFASSIAVSSFSYFSIPKIVFEIASSEISDPVEQISTWQIKVAQFDLFMVIGIVYIFGAAFLLLRIFRSYLASLQMLRCSSRTLINGHVVLLNKNITSPLSFGFFRGKIFFPNDFGSRLNNREVEQALAHECAHVENYDPLWKLISLIVRSLLFFAPWAYFLHSKLMFEMEVRCDESARENTKSSVKEYGSFLLAMAQERSLSLVFSNFTGSVLKRRITAMKKSTTSRPVLTVLLCSILISLSGIATASVCREHSFKKQFKVESEVFFGNQLLSNPKLIAFEGEKAVIEITNKENNELFKFSLVPSTFEEGQIKLTFEISSTGAGHSFDVKPYIIIAPGQKGTISVATDSGKVVELKTVATIQTGTR
ncbi:MAG: M56 family metallopeptidase [Myxococcales bacterium]|nr:M56 family metallopeptidase [Myxococcales bacterium]USN49807.1 MAG: M56 family metallopeptidase [Myxococcales bacterium]